VSDLTQSDRLIQITTPLGPDVLVPRSFEGTEEISRLFEYRLVLASENGSIDPTAIVGKRVTVSIFQSDLQTNRYFDGFVSHFTKLPRRPPHRLFYEYEIRMVPWTWFLTRTTNCRIFQEKTVPQVIEQIFQDFSFTDYQPQFTGTHNPWTYCVQYRETAFDFISRLMEKEGIFYFFKHEDGKHTMMLGDKSSVHQDCPYQSTMGIEPATGYLRDVDTVHTWERHYQYRSGKWAQTDYNFETPTTSLLTNESTVISLDKIQSYELFDYPGVYDNKGDGESLTKLRMEEVEIAFDTARGESDCRSFAAGFKFTLKDHEQTDQNQPYTLLSVAHSAGQGSLYGGEGNEKASYQNSFECFPSSVEFRAQRQTPRPIVHGSQTAVVVGPSGEEIYTDNYGRVKVQFFWDRLGVKDENSSCWIRVSQPWAGKNWGAVWIPRIGQEVVVDFLEGDPDRPLIVGRVYNEQQTVPYALPANSTQSGFKSRSSKSGGSSDFNELRFEDKTGSEEIHIQAQKDMTILIKHDETTTINNDRTETVSQNETGNIGQKRDWTIGTQDKLTVGEKQAISVGQEIDIQAGMKISIQAGAQIQITCGGSSITMNPGMITIQAPLVKIN
jgi:type VI secretion system secreted protein VgrG